MPMELRQEGISAAGIGGRIIEDERTRAIQESNLLAEIGLEQDARKMKSESLEKQAGFIKDDIALQNKIQQQLTDQENKVLEQARNLRKDSLSAFSDILKSFEGLAWTDLDPQSQTDLSDTAKQFNIPLNLLTDAMSNSKRQRVFDNAIKAQSGTKESVVDIRQRKGDLADLLGQVASYRSRDEAVNELNKYQSSIITRIGQEGFNQLQQEIDRLFPPPKEEPKEEIGGGILGAVGGFFSRLFQR